MRALVLFTRDLRIHDHPALWEACRTAEEIVPLFVVDPDLIARSPNRARFLSECLAELSRSIEGRRGRRLIVREDDVATAAARVALETDCNRIFLTKDAGVLARRLGEMTRARAVQVVQLPGHAVVEPGTVTPQGGAGAYGVFGPYLRAWTGVVPARTVLGAPRAIRVPRDIAPGHVPDPGHHRPDAVELPPGGEPAGRRRMHAFLAHRAAAYAEDRNDLAGDRTSRLSPYLRFGCVSVAELASRAGDVTGAQEFLRQLAWRDFFYQMRADRPWMTWRDLRPGSADPPPVDEEALEAWIAGCTGWPLVDAGMRQLHREGWMHNRARLVTASFLTRRAGIPWQVGAAHFCRYLVDGDPANNAGNWQWVAGTGAAPRRSRPLSPLRQAERFDASAAFVRRHVPELAGVETAAVLRPWRHPDVLLRTGYPAPILA